MQLSRVLRARVSEETAHKYEKLSEESGLKVSEVIRRVLEKSNPKLPSKEGTQYQLRAIRLMNKSSNNINQIAHHLNTLKLQNKLEYEEFIHYLRILDTIAAQQHLLLKLFDNI